MCHTAFKRLLKTNKNPQKMPRKEPQINLSELKSFKPFQIAKLFRLLTLVKKKKKKRHSCTTGIYTIILECLCIVKFTSPIN